LSPVIVAGVDTIDITAASTDIFALNHSEYAESNDVLQDLGKLIQEGLRHPDRRFKKLKIVTSAKGSYWRYAADSQDSPP
jgi:esterase/lipase superfamily enzyme